MSITDDLTQCASAFGEGTTTEDILGCVGESIQQVQDGVEASALLSIKFLFVLSAALVFFMQAGFAMLCAGAVRRKNVQNTMLKNLLDACGASVAYFTVGYAFSFGGSDPTSPEKTFIGNTNFFLMDVPNLGFWLFQYAFSAASATIVAGTLAERCQMAAYLCYSLFLVGFIYPVIVHAIWSPQGFLSATNIEPLWDTGMIDFAGKQCASLWIVRYSTTLCLKGILSLAGGGVVHVTGGLTALFATMILGPRRGRFRDEEGKLLEVPKEFPGHSMALQVGGIHS